MILGKIAAIDKIMVVKVISSFLIMAALFASGASIWKVQNQGFFNALSLPNNYGEEVSKLSRFRGKSAGFVVDLGNTQVSSQEIEWEISLIKNQLKIENVNQNDQNKLQPEVENALEKYQLMMAIERKVLYGYVQQDTLFSIDNPERYLSCIAEWQKFEANVSIQGYAQRESKFLKESLCEKSILEQYLKEVIEPKIEVSDLEIKKYYEDHIKQFTRGEFVEIKHILIGEEAAALRIRAMAHPKNFSSLAKKYSIAPEARAGGVLPPFPKGGLVPVFDRAFAMRPQEISEVIRSDYGYHIMMLEGKVTKGRKNIGEVTGEIRDILFQQKRATEYQKWMERALAKLPVGGAKYIW